uniref:SAUR family protein n=1 Tax=Kalanchoe fedtschenkoi TaxID=63787 RepID=A0A7N0VB01_KALFE
MNEDGGGTKVTGIRQIVRLKELLQKWQSVTLTPRPNTPRDPGKTPAPIGIPPVVNRRLQGDVNWTCDSDEETYQSPEPPHDVPKGYLAVYVGSENRRFIVPTSYLSHPLFKVLLEKAEEEYGFDHGGALMLPCDVETFKYLLKCMETRPTDHPHDDDDDNNHNHIIENGDSIHE